MRIGVLDDDARLAADPAADLEAHRAAGAGLDHTVREDDPLGCLPLLVHGVDLVELRADRVGDHRDRVAPGEDQHLRVLEDRLLLERLAESHRRVVAV